VNVYNVQQVIDAQPELQLTSLLVHPELTLIKVAALVQIAQQVTIAQEQIQDL
jgi:hypothetical protein